MPMLHWTLVDLGGVAVFQSIHDATVRIAEVLHRERDESPLEEAVDFIFDEHPDLTRVQLSRDDVAALLMLALSDSGQVGKPLMFKMERKA